MDWLLDKIREYGTSVGLRILAALLVLVIGLKLSDFIVKRIRKGRGFAKMDQSVAGFFASFLSITLKVIVIVSVIAILGVPMSSVVAVVASAGVAVGLAVQGALSNFVGGFMILIFKPFRKGDYIEADGVTGTVRDITVFYTVLATFDNRIITIPNGGLTNTVVTNFSAEPKRRVDLDFGAGYDDDVDKVKEVLYKAIAETANTLSDPAPAVLLTEHGESSIKYTVRVWVEKDNYWDVRFSLIEKVKKLFDENGINIPYNQMDIHIKKD